MLTFKESRVSILPKKPKREILTFASGMGKIIIEAKDPSVTNLDYIERYVILFFEFRLYGNGQRMAQAMIGCLENIKELFGLFFSFSLPKVQTALSLAIELAKRARFLRDEVISAFMKPLKNILSGPSFCRAN